MKVVNFKKIAFLFLSVVALTSCTKQQFSDLYDPNYLQEQAKEAFPVKDLDPTHTWEMMSTRTASVEVGGSIGESYVLKVYSDNPVLNSSAPLMAKATVAGGITTSISFDAATALETVYVARQGNDGFFVVQARLNGNQFVGSFESSTVARSASRSVIVGGNDPFPLAENKISVPTDAYLVALFPSSVPSDAITAPQTINNNTQGDKLVLSTGTYTLHYWGNVGKRELYVAPNSTVDFTGSVSNGLYSATETIIYLLPGSTMNIKGLPDQVTFTLVLCEGSTCNVSGGLILSTGGERITIYNSGAIKASLLNLANNAEVFNYGTLTLPNGINESPGAGKFARLYNGSTGSINTGKVSISGEGSYFLNDGTFKGTDLEVVKFAFENNGETELSSVLLKGSGNLYNTGKMNVTGLTDATNSGCYWINNGYYSSGEMRYNSWNSTFYNYCQLLVRGKLQFSDCTFNLMDNGYVQCNSLDLGQGTVEMGSNSAFYVENGTYISKRQGDGQIQGFKGVGSSGLVKLGGNTTIIGNHTSILSFTGNLNYAAENMFPTEGNDNLNADATKGVLYAEANISAPTEEQCAPAWSIGTGGGSTEDDPYLFTYGFEDMTKEVGDYDFNDVVLQVTAPVGGKIQVTLLAAGATKELRVGFKNHSITDVNNPLYDGLLFDGKTVYEVLGVPAGTITNTVTMNGTPATVELEVGGNFSLRAHGDFYIIDALGAKIHIPEFTANFQPGYVPYAMRVPKDWAYPRERISIEEAYPDFVNWAQNAKTSTNWYDNPVADKVFYITR